MVSKKFDSTRFSLGFFIKWLWKSLIKMAWDLAIVIYVN